MIRYRWNGSTYLFLVSTLLITTNPNSNMKYLEKILLLNHISATTTQSRCDSQSYAPANADCRDYSIPVTVISENLQWTGPRWTDDYELVDFLTVSASRSSASPYGNATEESGSYTIGATFCAPKNGGAKAKTVLVATHGLGYDRRFTPTQLSF